MPFIFIYHPALILQGPWSEVVWVFFLAAACIILTAAASFPLGYFLQREKAARPEQRP